MKQSTRATMRAFIRSFVGIVIIGVIIGALGGAGIVRVYALLMIIFGTLYLMSRASHKEHHKTYWSE